MQQYQDLVRQCLEKGSIKKDRTGTGTRSIFGHQMRFDLSEEFPIVTTKRTYFKGVVAELLWFLSGSSNVRDLRDMDCKIWNQWENELGTIGPMYGAQWRGLTGHGVDQISSLVDGLTRNPDSRRHIVSAWNVEDLPEMALAPCHAMFQCYVSDNKLSLQVLQRSADVFLGLPFNIASYALLTHMLAKQCGYEVGELIWTGGDCHLYENHLEQAKLLLTRDHIPGTQLHLRRGLDIFHYQPTDFSLSGYNPHPAISAPVAV